MSKFKYQVGFIQWFMNVAVSHLASRKDLYWAAEMETFSKPENQKAIPWDKELKNKTQDSFKQGHLPLGREGIRQMTSLMLTRESQTDGNCGRRRVWGD